MKTAVPKRLSVLAALLDGNSVRATSRMTGAHQDTISRFALDAGKGAGVPSRPDCAHSRHDAR